MWRCRILLLVTWATVIVGQSGDSSLSGFMGSKDNLDSGKLSEIQRIFARAEQGVVESQYNAGLLKLYGAEGVRVDLEHAHQYFLKAALQGHGDAQTNVGLMYLRGIGCSMSPQSAARWFEEAIRGSHASAQWMLGRMYYDGKIGVLPSGKPNFRQAAMLFESSAELGNSKGQFNLGIMHEYGLGVPQDYEKASTLYRMAAQQGDKEASYYAGVMSLYGRGVHQDFKGAAALIREAAVAGYAPAMNLLGKLFTHGQGVEKDYRLALAWFTKAADSAEDGLRREAEKSREELKRLLELADKKMLEDVKTYYL